MLPDPVTCFSAAKYEQFQTFYLDVNASLVLVDWCTSGRRERGEIWDFDYYRSTNHVMLAGKPLFLDSVMTYFLLFKLSFYLKRVILLVSSPFVFWKIVLM